MLQLRSARAALASWVGRSRNVFWLVVCIVSPLTFATSVAQACVPGDFCHPPEVPADCNLYICRAVGGGTCWPDRPIICDDGDPCTVNTCVNSQCVYTPISDGQPCQGPPDNNRCLVGGTCQSGACTDKVPAQCNDNNPCTTDSCDPVTGCTYTLISCDDGNECTTDTCVSQTGACSHAPRPGTCDDNNPCTFNDTCTTNANGEFVCLGSSACPSDNNLCTDDIPDPDTCECFHTPHDCSDGIACTTDTCATSTGCAHQPHPAAQAVAVTFGSNQTATWGPTSDATFWNAYRGDPRGADGEPAVGGVRSHLLRKRRRLRRRRHPHHRRGHSSSGHRLLLLRQRGESVRRERSRERRLGGRRRIDSGAQPGALSDASLIPAGRTPAARSPRMAERRGRVYNSPRLGGSDGGLQDLRYQRRRNVSREVSHLSRDGVRRGQVRPQRPHLLHRVLRRHVLPR